MKSQWKPSKKYFKALEGLYGSKPLKDANENRSFNLEPPIKPNRVIPTEDQEQFALVKWMRANNILHYHVPNQRQTTVQYGVRLKALGVSPGVPDLCIPIARKGYHGLYLELKRTKGGSVSEYQQHWIKRLNEEGYKAVVCLGAEQAIEIIKDYFKND